MHGKRSILIWAVLAVLAGCGPKKEREDTVEAILSQPGAYKGKTVLLTGRVTRVVDFGNGVTGFELAGPDGTIAVKPNGMTPPLSSRVTLRATVETDCMIGAEKLDVVLIVTQIVRLSGRAGREGGK